MNRKIVMVMLFASVLLLSMVTRTQFVALVRAEASKETLGIYNFIESLSVGSVVIISFDYGPATKIENHPQAKAFLFHCKELGLRVIGVAFWVTGAPIGEDIFTQVYGEDFQDLPEYGTEFVYIGFIPGGAVGISTFADNTWLAISIDHFNTPFTDLPLMDEVRSAEDFDFWMEIMSGTPGVSEVIMYVQTPHGGPEGLPVGAACIEPCYSGIKPYYDSGYLIGILRGFQGTLEYEWLLRIYYGVGVETGVWVKYGNVTAEWDSNDPKAKPPNFLNIEWINNTIQRVHRKNITFQFITHYKNDTETTGSACIDVYTGEGNGAFWFVSAGLVPGGSIYASPEWTDWKINETVSKTYVSVTRDTNHLTMTRSQFIPSDPPQNVTVSVNYYWNKVTGALTEYQKLFLNQTGEYTTSWSLSYKIIDTNLWTTIDVPANYSTIQEAIDAAKPGDTVHVREGIYLEHITISKSLMLVGENSRTTIIDGTGDETVITISAENIEISGFTVQNGRDGIVVMGHYRGNTIQGNTICNHTQDGIFIWYANNSVIKENIIASNGLPNEWGYGIEIYESHNNLVYNNTVMNNWYGIRLSYSSVNILSHNNMTDNHFNFGVHVWSNSLTHFIHNIDTSNIVNGKPIYYLINQHNITIDPTISPSVGYLGIVNSTNIVVKDLNTSRVGEGILFAWTNNSTIENIQTSNNHYGLALLFSNSNVVSENTLESIYHTSIITFSSNNNTVIGNRISDSSIGFSGNTLNNSTISRNTISNSGWGIRLTFSSTKNKIYGNTMKNSWDFGITLSTSSHNHIFHNNFINNTNQVGSYDSVNTWDDSYPSGGNYWSDYNGTDFFSGSYQNETGSDGIGDTPYDIDEDNQDNYPLIGPWTITGENVTVTHASGVSLTFANVTSSGITTVNETQTGPEPPTGFKLALEPPIYYIVGTETNYSGPITLSIAYNDTGLTEEEENGLRLLHWNETQQQWTNITTHVDTENNIIHGETSHLSMFAVIAPRIHNIALTGVISSKTVVGRGFNLSINVTIHNVGDYTETFNLTAKANSTVVETIEITLSESNSTTVTFTWNTTGWAKGNYIISAVVDTVLDETDPTDNTLTDGWVIVAMVGDLSGLEGVPDGLVDIDDVVFVAVRFGSCPGHENWNINADITNDNLIDIDDVMIPALHFGETDP